MKWKVQCYLAAILVFNSGALHADHSTSLDRLTYVTEEYPPYNYTFDNELTGIAVDLLLRASEISGDVIPLSGISVLPWSEGYRAALVGDDTVVFSTTRTKLREHLFQWVGPISKTRIVVLAHRESGISINSVQDLMNHSIGVIRDDVGEQLLLELGVPRESMQERSGAQALARSLKKKRIDLWAYEENVARWWFDKSGYNQKDFEVVYLLKESELYYAFNKNIDLVLINKLQRALNIIKENVDQNGLTEYQTIINKYR
ncbi:transporter substrate-binding domain-containing protein [Vibrio sp. S4M6]|uniref:substrate-binding periplasmic protein n=1 Tax=Vibrio sinus TaxID=2946865 RepID=UPI00202ABB7F|nr:transporter substrate-binding domain-containing protein [Vibrio sinus]MCL9781334.1 transporter substrate-binding domain-containing protein [Vibrio sinus]